MYIGRNHRDRVRARIGSVIGIAVALGFGLIVSARQHRAPDTARAMGDTATAVGSAAHSGAGMAIAIAIGALALVAGVVAIMRANDTKH